MLSSDSVANSVKFSISKLVSLKNHGTEKDNLKVELQTTENYSNVLFGVHALACSFSAESTY